VNNLTSKHILFIISSLEAGGAEKIVCLLADYLLTQGAKVRLLTFQKKDLPSFYPLASAILREDLNLVSEKKDTKLNRLIQLRKKIKTLSPDVIISFMDKTNLSTLLAHLGFSIPVIACERSDPVKHHLPLFYQFLRTFLYPRAKQVVVQTDHAKKYFHRLKNVVVIPNPVFKPLIEKTNISLSQPVVKIMGVGRLCYYKGWDSLIRALAALQNQIPNMMLEIYGEGENRKTLEQLIQELNLSQHIFLRGLTQNLPQKLYQADLFIFPSRYEGFPNALAEAMAMGLPVIASDCPGNLALVQDNINGLIFPVDAIDILAEKIKSLLENEEKRRTLATQAKKIADIFSPHLIFKQWEKVIGVACQNPLP